MLQRNRTVCVSCLAGKAQQRLPDTYVLAPGGLLQLDYEGQIARARLLEKVLDPALVEDTDLVVADALIGIVRKALQAAT